MRNTQIFRLIPNCTISPSNYQQSSALLTSITRYRSIVALERE
jgi:hypothetical protein